MLEGTQTDGMAMPVPADGQRMGWIAAGLLAGAVALLFVLAALESRWLHSETWSQALRTEDYLVQDASAIEVWSRKLSLDQSVGDSATVEMIQADLVEMFVQESAKPVREQSEPELAANPFDTAKMLDLAYLPRAYLLMAKMTSSEMEPLLAEGRLPEPGKPEVLGGYLTSSRDLVVDGQTFTVVGKIRPQARGFVKTYLLPADDAMRPYFAVEAGGKHGSLVREGLGRLNELVPELADPEVVEKPTVFLGPVPTHPFVAWGVWFSLLIAAVGSTLGFITLYRKLAVFSIPLLNITMRESVLRSRLLWGLHILLFGAFFGAMFVGMRDPELNYLFTEYASHTFREGGLKYVGDAYQSGVISRAAHATFHNNYIVQTLLFTSGSSLVVPLFIGVLKTAASFLVVGFAMAPLWAETASGMTYHVITLVLELPPYILASFGVAVWSISVCRFLWSPVRVWYLADKAAGQPIIEEAALQVPRSLLVLIGTTLLSGVFLYVAAWYEATTLILLR